MFCLKEFPKNCVPLINCLNLKPINWAPLIVTVLCLSDLFKGNAVTLLLTGMESEF